ncbi:hypothetical protein [Chloroflexus sp.]|uniref:hypothetical protein n=1 Tax=Chloroflexus sp. TaxID=1904827 RepID=UPI002ACE59B5|nr:hypothetical protein [Chloroflexus sp.]
MYVQREPIGGIGENRVWSILTVENAAGAAVGGGIMYGIAQALRIAGEGFGVGFWIQLVMIAAGIAIGAIVTIRIRGLSLVDRLIIFVGFQMRRASGQHRVDPPIEASIWALTDETDDLLPLLDEDMLAALNEGFPNGRA